MRLATQIYTFALCWMTALVVQGHPVQAHSASLANLSVVERQSTYSQTPWRQSGLMLWRPTVTTGLSYSDNIRATYLNKQSDLAMTITPALLFKTARKDQGFTGALQLDRIQFAQYQAQNQTNGDMTLAPYKQLGNQWSATALVRMRFAHEMVSADTAQPLANEPTPYQQTHVSGRLNHDSGMLMTDFFAGSDYYTYDNTRLITGVPLINDDRNRIDAHAGFTVGIQDATHEQSVGWRNELLKQDFARADFNNATGSYSGLDRDNAGWRSQLTCRLKPTKLLTLNGNAGFEHKNFQRQWTDKTVFIGQLQGIYRLTSLTDLTFGFDRDVDVTAYDAAPAFTRQTFKGGLVHELKRNIVLNFSLSNGTIDYWNNSRRDTVTSSQVGLDYRQNRAVTWQASYRYRHRDSTLQIADYRENNILFGARIEF